MSWLTIASAGAMNFWRSLSVCSRMRCRSSMLNRHARSPSWMRGSKSRGTAMSRITIGPPARCASTRWKRSKVTTGSGAPVVTLERFQRVLAQRAGGPMVILDIAVPRDFDPRIHDGDRACLFNIDDLQRIREQTLRERQKFIAPAEAIVSQLMAKLNGRLSPEDRAYVEGAFKLLQNQFLHGPISALSEETQGEAGQHT